MTGFGERIKSGSPSVNKTKNEKHSGEQTLSAQEKERRSRSGRRPTSDNSPRVTDTYAYTSLALHNETYEKIREIARRNGLPNRDLVNAALRKYVELYEAKNGPIEPSRESKISADSLI